MAIKVKLRLKIALLVAPIVFVAFVGYAFWIIQVEEKGVLKISLRLMAEHAEALISEHLQPRYQVLERNGLANIPSYRQRYQEEAFASMLARTEKVGGQVLLIDDRGNVKYRNREVSQPVQTVLDQVEAERPATASGATFCTDVDQAAAQEKLYCSTGFPPWDLRVVYLRDTEKLTAGFTIAREQVLLVAAVIALGLSALLLWGFNRFLVARLNRLGAHFALVRRGDLSVRAEVVSDDEIGALEAGFNRMTATLEENAGRASEQKWLRQGLSEMDELLRGDPRLQELAQAALDYLAKRAGALMGGLYIQDEDATFQLCAGYAISLEKAVNRVVTSGQGLAGQAVAEGRMLETGELPPEYFKVLSGLGTSRPRHLLISPLIYHQRVYGVLELAAFEPFSDLKRQFIQQASMPLAVALSVAKK